MPDTDDDEEGEESNPFPNGMTAGPGDNPFDGDDERDETEANHERGTFKSGVGPNPFEDDDGDE